MEPPGGAHSKQMGLCNPNLQRFAVRIFAGYIGHILLRLAAFRRGLWGEVASAADVVPGNRTIRTVVLALPAE